MRQETDTGRRGTKVKIGSPVFLRYMGRPYRGTIKEIRGRSKMFLVEFTHTKGKRVAVWKRATELGPASPHQPDAAPTEVKILPPAEVPL